MSRLRLPGYPAFLQLISKLGVTGLTTVPFTIVANLVVWPGLLCWIYMVVIVARARGLASVSRTWAIRREFSRIVSEESRPRIKQRYKVALHVLTCSMVAMCLLFVYAIWSSP